MEMETETAAPSGEDLVAALEQATLMAKQLSITTNPHQILQIYTTLQSADRHLSLFLSHYHPFPPASALQPPPENSVPTALGGGYENGNTGGDPMQMGDEDVEKDSKASTSAAAIDKVEERMRDCYIQNKRPKRQLSPSAEQRRSNDNGDAMGDTAAAYLDPHGTKLRSLDLIYQFHG